MQKLLDRMCRGKAALSPREQGRRAFANGLSAEANPYRFDHGHSSNRRRWFAGWYDEKLEPVHRKLDAMLSATP